MKKQFRAVLFLALVLSLALAGCQRSASKSVVNTPAATGEIPFPLPTENILQSMVNSTQTAQAAPPAASGQTPGASEASSTLPPLVLPSVTPPEPVTPTITPTFAIVPTATPGLPATYTLHTGEYVYCLARRFNIDPGDLLAANNLDMNSRPAVGTVLTIPAGAGKWSAGSRALIAHPAVYTVKPDDTIYSVACDFGDADPNAIILANHLTDPYTLTPGQTIQVP